jgi:hypothetical protein
MSNEKNDIKDWSADQLRREVYRLRHKITEERRKRKAKETIVEYLQCTERRRLIDAVREIIPDFKVPR